MTADLPEAVRCRNGSGEELDRLLRDVMTLQAPRAVAHIDSIMEIIDIVEEVRLTIEAGWQDGKTIKPARIVARGELSERHVDIVERILGHFQPFGHAHWAGDEESAGEIIGPASLNYMPLETMSGHDAIELRGQAAERLVAFLVETGLSHRVAEDLVGGA